MRLIRKPKVIVPIAVVSLLVAIALAVALVRSGAEHPVDSDSRAAVVEPASQPLSATADQKAEAGSEADSNDADGRADSSDAGGRADSSDAGGEPPAARAGAPHHLRRSGEVSLLVSPGKLAATVTRINGITRALGGYVMSSTIVTDGAEPATASEPQAPSDPAPTGAMDGSVMPADEAEEPYAWITLRVPEARFNLALQRVSGLGDAQTVSTASEDVTSQYVDLEARLRHFRQVERRLLRFLAETRSMRDMLTVQDRLDETQLTIEQLTAELASLRETTTFATLTVSVRERPAGQATDQNAFWAALSDSLAKLAGGARALALFATALLPFALVLGGIAGMVWWVVRRVRRRRAAASSPASPATDDTKASPNPASPEADSEKASPDPAAPGR